MIPDLDNIAVGRHTHEKPRPKDCTAPYPQPVHDAVIVLVLFCSALGRKSVEFSLSRFGAGILIHILLDLVLWFNGVGSLAYPLELNFWSWFSVPAWLENLLSTAEFLAFGLFFWMLVWIAAKNGTDKDYQPRARLWAYLMFGLFVIFTIMAFTMSSGWFTIYGGLYLLALFLAVGVTIRMKPRSKVCSDETPVDRRGFLFIVSQTRYEGFMPQEIFISSHRACSTLRPSRLPSPRPPAPRTHFVRSLPN
jgi:hypothetical protein